MKLILLVCCFGSLGTPLGAQPIPIDEISGPDNSISDSMYEVTTRYPVGWVIRGAARWGDHGNRATTIFFGAPDSAEASPNLYYRKFHAPMLIFSGGAESWLRDEARRKVEQRVTKEGIADYKNRPESFVLREVGGHAALSWSADYTRSGDRWVEYLTAVLSENGLALFFLQAPADQIKLVVPKYEQMIIALRMP
jgi:hypothetical protein